MNREHYLFKRLHSQYWSRFDRHDKQESGVDASTFSLATEVCENKRLSAGIVAKAEAVGEPNMKSGVR